MTKYKPLKVDISAPSQGQRRLEKPVLAPVYECTRCKWRQFQLYNCSRCGAPATEQRFVAYREV